MKENELEIYIKQLLNTLEVDNVLKQLPQIKLLLVVYKAGLLHEDFPIEKLYGEVSLEEISPMFHNLIAHLAILASQKSFPSGSLGIVAKQATRELEEFDSFLTKEK